MTLSKRELNLKEVIIETFKLNNANKEEVLNICKSLIKTYGG